MNDPGAPWHRIRLSREEYESGEVHVVQGVFQAGFIARNGPAGAALYGGWNREGSSFALYFTPACWTCARALFSAYSAEACGPPQMGQLALICGDPLHGVEF